MTLRKEQLYTCTPTHISVIHNQFCANFRKCQFAQYPESVRTHRCSLASVLSALLHMVGSRKQMTMQICFEHEAFSKQLSKNICKYSLTTGHLRREPLLTV